MVDMPRDRKIIDKKWGFKLKENEVGDMEILKARWVVKGYMKTY